MDQYLPADTRAEITLIELLQPFVRAVTAATALPELSRAYSQSHLPPKITNAIELRVNMRRQLDLEQKKELAIDTARSVVAYNICQDLNLPSQDGPEETRIYYYLREDLMAWVELHRGTFSHFVTLPKEIIRIEIEHGEHRSGRQMELSQDQMLGIAYGLAGIQMETYRVTLTSSITQAVVDVNTLAKHALIYRLPLNLATEELQRPYRVEVLEPGGSYIRLRFVNPEFMQGLLSVAHWYRLENQGRGYLWQHLEQFTREGIIPLGF